MEYKKNSQKYICVLQGEYATVNGNEILVTGGLGPCIGITFINGNNRSMLHIDAPIISSHLPETLKLIYDSLGNINSPVQIYITTGLKEQYESKNKDIICNAIKDTFGGNVTFIDQTIKDIKGAVMISTTSDTMSFDQRNLTKDIKKIVTSAINNTDTSHLERMLFQWRKDISEQRIVAVEKKDYNFLHILNAQNDQEIKNKKTYQNLSKSLSTFNKCI